MCASTAEKLAPPQAETEALKGPERPDVVTPEQADITPEKAMAELKSKTAISEKANQQTLDELGNIARQIEELVQKERWDRRSRDAMAEQIENLKSTVKELQLKFADNVKALEHGIVMEGSAKITGKRKEARANKTIVRQEAATLRKEIDSLKASPENVTEATEPKDIISERVRQQQRSELQQKIVNAAHVRALKEDSERLSKMQSEAIKEDAEITAKRDRAAKQKEKEVSALEKIEQGKAKEAKNLAKDMVWAKKDIGEQEGDDTKRRENEGKPEKVRERIASLLIQRGTSSESALQNNLFLMDAIKAEAGLKPEEIPTQADFDKIFAKKESIKKAQESERARIAQEARDKIAKKEQEASAKAEKKQETEKQTALNNLASKLKKAEFNGRAAFTGSGGLEGRETAGRVNLAKELLKNPAYSNASELPSELIKLLKEKMEMTDSQFPDKKDFEAAKESLDNSREGVGLKLQRTYKKDAKTIQRVMDIYDDLTQGGPIEDSVLGQIALLSREQGITVEQLREFMPGVNLPSAEAIDARITKIDEAAEGVSGKAWEKKVKGYKAGDFGNMSKTAEESMYLEEKQLRAVASAKKTAPKPGFWSKLKSLFGGGEKPAVPPQERKGRKAA